MSVFGESQEQAVSRIKEEVRFAVFWMNRRVKKSLTRSSRMNTAKDC